MKFEKNDLTIYEVEDIHKELKQELSKGDIVIDLNNVNSLDMSVIQLFVSTHKSCLAQNKNFTLSNNSQEVTDILKTASCEFLLGSAK